MEAADVGSDEDDATPGAPESGHMDIDGSVPSSLDPPGQPGTQLSAVDGDGVGEGVAPGIAGMDVDAGAAGDDAAQQNAALGPAAPDAAAQGAAARVAAAGDAAAQGSAARDAAVRDATVTRAPPQRRSTPGTERPVGWVDRCASCHKHWFGGVKGSPGEWVECQSCSRWFHLQCTGYDGGPEFICSSACPGPSKRARLGGGATVPGGLPDAPGSTGLAAAPNVSVVPVAVPVPPSLPSGIPAGPLPRVFCPVAGCPKACSASSPGWSSLSSMKAHLQEHAAGRVDGALPIGFLREHKLDLCRVCGLVISSRSGGACPSCWPVARAPTSSSSASRSLPSLEDVFSRSSATLKHVPKAARSLWARCLGEAVEAAMSSSSVEAWVELLMLPKCVLVVPPRRGKKHQARRFTESRCERWLGGERMELWLDGRSSPPRRPGHSSDDSERRWKRVEELVRDGQYSKACRTLLSQPPLEESVVVEDKLRRMHPSVSADPDLSSFGPAGPAPVVSPSEVKEAIFSFPRGSAPGPTGLRAQHLQDAIRSADGETAVTKVAALVSLLSRGLAPAAVQPFLAGARLIALPKKDDKIRPVAVGECFRRLVAKCLCRSVREEARSRLWPLQSGVAVPLGVECGVHTVRQWFDRNANDRSKVLLKIDFSNAFNSIDRGAFLREVRHHLPGLSRWAEWCYGSPSNLIFGRAIIPSEVGVQQGDPLGPLCFALGIQPILEKIAADGKPELDLVSAFLDDVVVAGSGTAVAAALSSLSGLAESVGLQLAPEKCWLVPAAGRESTVDCSLFPGDFQVCLDRSVEILGAPVGDRAFCSAFAGERVDKAEKLLKAIGELEDPQVALHLLRQCASYGKVVFVTRCTPPDLIAAELGRFDVGVRRCFESFSGLFPDDSQWRQASLAIRHGGLGLRSAAEHSAAAYVASFSSCRRLCGEIDGCFARSAAVPPAVDQAVTALNAVLAEPDRVPVSVPQPLRQQSLSLALERAAVSALLEPVQGNLAFRAHLSLMMQPHAGDWLQAVPCERLGLAVAPALFRVMLQVRLRDRLYERLSFCPLCDAVLDVFGDHSVQCPCGGDRTARHNAIRNLAARFLNSAGLRPEVEKPGLLPFRARPGDGADPEQPPQPGLRRPADVFAPRWELGQPVAFDFAVASGMKAGALEESARDGSHAAAAYAEAKRRHLDTAAECRAHGLLYIPMVCEAHGGSWDAEALEAWRKVAKAREVVSGEPWQQVFQFLMQSLSVGIQRANARAVIGRGMERGAAGAEEWC